MGNAAKAVILVLSELHALVCAKCAEVALIETGERATRKRAIERSAHGSVEQPHSVADVFGVGRRRTEVLAKQHGIIARRFGVEAAIAAVVILDIRAVEVGAIPMHPIED